MNKYRIKIKIPRPGDGYIYMKTFNLDDVLTQLEEMMIINMCHNIITVDVISPFST